MIVLVIALLVFGPKRLPELGRQVGRGIRELKTQVSAITEDVGAAVGGDPDRDSAASSAAGPVGRTRSASSDAVEVEDDLLDGVVVSGATGPAPQTPAGA